MLAFLLVTIARQLRPYFHAHPIKVLTKAPQKKILQKPDASGRLVGLSIELSDFNMDYLLRHTTEDQALADFIAEFTGFLEEVAITPVKKL